MTRPPQQEIRKATSKGEVRIRSFCTPEEIRRYSFHDQFASHAQYKSLYTRKESLIGDAARPEANVVLALTAEDRIVGFGVLAYPDPGERWLQLGKGLMTEVRVIEISREWRAARLASDLLGMLLTHPEIEEKIAYMVGYAWTWDLDGTGLKAQTYRQLLIKLFSSYGFKEFETNEPNICLKHENLFMCRVGKKVPQGVVDQFSWLRFGITSEISEHHGAGTQETQTEELVNSLFLPLREEKLTWLGIHHDWKCNRLVLRAAREWEADTDWTRYQRDFTTEHPLTSNAAYLNHDQTWELFHRYRLHGYLDDVSAMIEKGRHQGLECFYEPRRHIRIIHFMHSNTLGRHNICHALRSGGICLFHPDRPEPEVIAEGLKLSRAMSFKNAGARLPFGGARVAIQAEAIDLGDYAGIGFIAYALDRTRTFVGPDMGFAPEVVDVMRREGYSVNITGGFDSKIGPPGASTAYGVYLALKEAAYIKFGTLNLAGKRIVVQGVGAVGFPLVDQYLTGEDAEIYVADLLQAPVEKLLARHPGQVHALAPEEVVSFAGDILMPCAIGGIIDESLIDHLKYQVIVGGANNTLKADTQKEEIRLADELERRGIVYVIDWLHNTAGIISGAEAYLNSGRESRKRVSAQVEKVCRDGVRQHLQAAAAQGVSPTEQAYRHYNAVIYG